MKKILFLFFTATATALTFFSCHQSIKEVIVPADTKITFVVPTEKEGEDYLILAADTTGDGLADIKIKVVDWPAISRICFLKEACPNKNIRIKTSGLSRKKSFWTLTAHSTNAAEKIIFIN
jgi:hypothetical protein